MARKPIYLSAKQADAALAAIHALSAGEYGQGDWPSEVSRADLEEAALRILPLASPDEDPKSQKSGLAKDVDDLFSAGKE